ncbi:protein chibby homolog 1 [Chrysoperla carnea]|uniref:protein chibby homolog 1 n=1 Tax=Chrysoperla carnea TaxID=189513 RepID=UPI001D08FDCB|nr:protein chibby homolog 1 [Chrysoperla carnea]
MNDMTTGDSIVMHLGNTETVFKKGTWSFETGVVGSIQKENYKLRKQIQQLEEEKNLLHLKYEILLNLCTQATVESHLKDCEIESLKKIS